jgi:hypothetical protein
MPVNAAKRPVQPLRPHPDGLPHQQHSMPNESADRSKTARRTPERNRAYPSCVCLVRVLVTVGIASMVMHAADAHKKKRPQPLTLFPRERYHVAFRDHGW